jgi:hypothetical protein
MGQRYFGVPPRFDPEAGTTILEPEAKGYGNWVGGHSVTWDPDERKFYLYYRVRAPLGKGRGGKCRIAESDDGREFTTLLEVTKDTWAAQSIELGCLIRDPYDKGWKFYVSYQQEGGPWRVDLIEAKSPRDLDPWHHRTVMQPEEYGLTAVKDPKAYIVGGMYYVFVDVKPRGEEFYEDEQGVRHPLASDATGLMTSADGRYFKDFRYVFEPGRGAPGDWGMLRARINSVLYLPPVYVGLFDGGTTFYDMYEEQCGIAVSHDLENWRRVSTDKPWVKSAHGCVRYVDALIIDGRIWYYYEYTRQDGSHELRLSVVEI